MRTLRGSVTLDRSAVMEYFMGTNLGRIIKEHIESLKSKEKVCCSLYSISEIFYVLCSLRGMGYAVDKLSVMLHLRVPRGNQHRKDDSRGWKGFDCERAILIGDCSCIATAKITGSRAILPEGRKSFQMR